MERGTDSPFLVNPELDMGEIQDAIILRTGAARAMAALLKGVAATDLNQIIALQYAGAMEELLEELDMLHDRLWELVGTGPRLAPPRSLN